MPDRTAFRPRRRWGQNFLVNRGAVKAILEAFGLRPDDRILEIGPGRGALTRHLVGAGRRVVAVEIDPILAAGLRRDLAPGAPEGSLTIVEGDILALDLARLLSDLGAPPARVIANLPYNIATAVILRLLERPAALSDLLVMVQREVAARLVAAPGGRTYGSLSVLCQAGAAVERVLRLGPGSFRPRPRVESEVVRLRPRHGGDGARLAGLPELLRGAFGQRRKTLLNNLARPLGRRAAERLLVDAGIDPAARPETLAVEAYVALLPGFRAARRASGASRDPRAL